MGPDFAIDLFDKTALCQYRANTCGKSVTVCENPSLPITKWIKLIVGIIFSHVKSIVSGI